MPTKVGFEHFVFLSTDTTGIDDDDELLRVTLME